VISIKKYLTAQDARRLGMAVFDHCEALNRLYQGLLGNIAEHVLGQPQYEPLREPFGGLRELVSGTLSPAIAERAHEVTEEIFREYSQIKAQTAATNAAELQNVVRMLSQALMVLAGGSQRSLSRLKSIEASLESTSRIQDIIALKASVADTLDFVKQESVREQELASREMSELEKEVARARELLAAARSGMPGREEAIQALKAAVERNQNGGATYVHALFANRLQGIIQRYGPDAAEELMMRLIEDRVRPIVKEGAVFRWSLASIVSVFQSERDLLGVRAQAAAANRPALVHKFPVGDRNALLTLTPSLLVSEVTPDSLNATIEELDQFTQSSR